MISILILTLNEEVNLPHCLATVGWSDDVVVLDSYSSDRTVEIARSRGAHVVQRTFDNWAAHQNWAVENIRFKHDWVFYLDADERMTAELKDELLATVQNSADQAVAYYCGRRNMFMGRWLKHAMGPGLLMRFFRPSLIRFERLVNPTPVIRGAHGYLRNYLVHYNFSKGLTEWIDKHNKYSQMEAIEGLRLFERSNRVGAGLFSSDEATRRSAMKNLSFRLPLRPYFKFFYLYFLKFGFLDGSPGLTYCVLQAIYEYMIVIKMRELERRAKGLTL